MDINFIITCYENEQNIPLLVQLLQSFKKIQPNIVVSYAGEKDIPCDVKIDPTSLKPQFREIALTVEGYRAFKRYNNTNKKFVKLSANVWPTNEDILIELLDRLTVHKTPYGGNYWHHNGVGSLAMDFFVMDLTYGDFLKDLDQVHNDSEVTLYQQLVVKKKKQPYIIPERDGIFWNNRYECKALGLVMRSTPQENLATMKDWAIE